MHELAWNYPIFLQEEKGTFLDNVRVQTEVFRLALTSAVSLIKTINMTQLNEGLISLRTVNLKNFPTILTSLCPERFTEEV